MKIKKTLPGIIISLAIISIVSCNTDQFDFNNLSDQIHVKQNFSVPVARGILNTQDLLETFDSAGYVNEDTTGLLYITYQDSIYSNTAENMINIKDQDFIEIFYESDSDVPSSTFGSDTTIIRDELHPFSLDNDMRLNSIETDEFTLEQEIEYSFENEGRLVVTYDSLLKGGEPYKDTINITDISGSYQTTRTVTLYDYTVKLANPDTSDKSYFPVHYEFTLYNSGNPISTGDHLYIDSRMINSDIYSARGYLGQDTLMYQSGVIPLNLFSGDIDGNIEFADPRFRFLIDNSYGVPADIAIKNAKAYTEGTTDTTELVFTDSANYFPINHPSYMGGTEHTSIEISNDNCNLSDVMAQQPTHIMFNAYAYSNPDGPLETNNFFYEDSRFDVSSEVMLPLWLKADNFSLQDTVELDLEQTLGDMDMIKSLIGKLDIKNGLPVEINFQVYLTDSTYAPVDSMFNASEMPVILGAQVDSEGNVIQPTVKYSEASFDEEEFDNLKKVKNAIFDARLTTSDFASDTKVKFYSDSEVEFKFGMDVKTDIQ
jgi:hypothetical protein